MQSRGNRWWKLGAAAFHCSVLCSSAAQHCVVLLCTSTELFARVYILFQNQYEKHKEVVAAQGVKILGKDLEKTLAGLPLLVAHKEDEVPVLKVRWLMLKYNTLRVTWALWWWNSNVESSVCKYLGFLVVLKTAILTYFSLVPHVKLWWCDFFSILTISFFPGILLGYLCC